MRFPAVLIALMMLSFGAHSSFADDKASSPANAVLDSHLKAFASGNVDAVMADYAEDAVFMTPEGVLKGKAEIRSLFERLIKEFSSPDASLTVNKRYASGPVAYITWSAKTPENVYHLATDTLYVADNRIRYQTFAAHITPK